MTVENVQLNTRGSLDTGQARAVEVRIEISPLYLRASALYFAACGKALLQIEGDRLVDGAAYAQGVADMATWLADRTEAAMDVEMAPWAATSAEAVADRVALGRHKEPPHHGVRLPRLRSASLDVERASDACALATDALAAIEKAGSSQAVDVIHNYAQILHSWLTFCCGEHVQRSLRQF